MSKRVRGNCRKLYLQHSKFEKRHNSKIDANWRHSNLICSSEKQSNMQTFSSICWRVWEKSAENCVFPVFLVPKRGITPTKIDANRRHSNLICSTVTVKQSYAKFELSMSKHVREKCGKLCISSILSSQRGITPTKIEAKWRNSNLLCGTLKKSHIQNLNSVCQSM